MGAPGRGPRERVLVRGVEVSILRPGIGTDYFVAGAGARLSLLGGTIPLRRK